MKTRTRYIWLAIFIVIGGILAIGARHQSPDADPDNQGGYAIVLLFFLILLLIYVPLTMRSIGERMRGGVGAGRQLGGDCASKPDK